MTIDEAIEKFKFIANSDAPCPRYCMLPCDKCVDESKQLAEWLEDYKRIKMLIPIEQALKAEHDKAIGDVMNMLNDIEFGGGTKETLACANAYSVDKVIEELEMEMEASSGYSAERVSAFSRAIEIVKAGGKYE